MLQSAYSAVEKPRIGTQRLREIVIGFWTALTQSRYTCWHAVSVRRLTSPQWVVAHLAQGSRLHSLVSEGLLPVPRQCWLSTSLDLPSGPFMQRTLLVVDPPPQLAEHGNQGSTRHLIPPQKKSGQKCIKFIRLSERYENSSLTSLSGEQTWDHLNILQTHAHRNDSAL